MEIFRDLNKLGYKHYLDYTVEKLDDLDIKSKEFSIESNLVFDWFREKYKLEGYINLSDSKEGNYFYYFNYINTNNIPNRREHCDFLWVISKLIKKHV